MSAAVLVTPDGHEFVERGEVRGTLTRSPRGEGGFGYDPIFVPEGFEVTTAQMSAQQKNAISHRGIALSLIHILRIARLLRDFASGALTRSLCAEIATVDEDGTISVERAIGAHECVCGIDGVAC